MIDYSAINILALNDEPFMLDVLLHMLGRLGFHHVAVADNGTSALVVVGSPQVWEMKVLLRVYFRILLQKQCDGEPAAQRFIRPAPY